LFSSFPQVRDFTNIIYILIVSAATDMDNVFFTTYLVKKCGLNNGRFLAVVALLYQKLMTRGRLDDTDAAARFLLWVARKSLKKRLAQSYLVGHDVATTAAAASSGVSSFAAARIGRGNTATAKVF
jgi:hypothetical protein